MTAIPSKGEIEVTLGGEARTLRFTIGDIESVEAALNVGLGEVIRRLRGAYRLTDVRTIIQVGLERAGWAPEQGKNPRDEVLALIRVEGPGKHVMTCIRMLNLALDELPGNAPAPEGAPIS